MGKLLVKEVLSEIGFASHQKIKQLIQTGFGVEKQVFGPVGFENIGKTIGFEVSDGRDKSLGGYRKLPDGDALIQIASQQPEKRRMGFFVYVDMVVALPDFSQPAYDGFRLVFTVFVDHGLFPFGRFFLAFLLKDNPVKNEVIDFVFGIQVPE